MFVIIGLSEKIDIESKECVCLSGINKIETNSDKTSVTFESLDARYDAEYELDTLDIVYAFADLLTFEFKPTQIIAIMP